ncbi:MAG TPA: PaaI family thioesterase [Mycobacteriales bacterium]|nr:PaaI family thioesterase [Mycobacteriales bacterium]
MTPVPPPLRVPLPNDFSVAQRCFGCGPRNGSGLALKFFAEPAEQRVVADFTMTREHSGAPMFVHGGLVMTLLDEAMAWSTIGIRRRFALTRDFRANFAVPLIIGTPYSVYGMPDQLVDGDRVIAVRGEIRDAAGTVCASAEGDYWVMSHDELAVATGLPQLTEEFLRYDFPEVPA